MNPVNFNDKQSLVALYVGMAEYDSVAEQMVGMISALIETDLPLESKQNILTEAQAEVSKVRKDSPKMATAYQYASRAKTIFGAVVQGFVIPDNCNCARIYSDAQKFLKGLSKNWKGEHVDPKTKESTPEAEVTSAAMASPIGDVEQVLETVEKHAAYLLETKGEQYAIDLIAVLTGLIDNPVKQAA